MRSSLDVACVFRSSPLLACLGVAALGGALAACAATTRDGFDPNSAPAETTPPEGGGETATGSSGGFKQGDAGPTDVDGCSDAAKLVYVLSLEGDLYSFAPAEKKFTKIGPLNCKLGSKKFIPISMAVDRDAVAWVNMREDSFAAIDSNLFKVDTKTATCTPTNIKGSMGGMGFSTNEGTTDKETLFVVGQGSTPVTSALVRVDFAKEKLVPVADLKEPVDMELTGTGDGRLFGFLMSQPLGLARIDKATTALSERVTLAKIEKPRAPMFAFSFWGGDFYFYTATDPAASKTSTVSRYRPSDKSLDNAYMTNIGFHIVGAGVSTCAPTTLPK